MNRTTCTVTALLAITAAPASAAQPRAEALPQRATAQDARIATQLAFSDYVSLLDGSLRVGDCRSAGTRSRVCAATLTAAGLRQRYRSIVTLKPNGDFSVRAVLR